MLPKPLDEMLVLLDHFGVLHCPGEMLLSRILGADSLGGWPRESIRECNLGSVRASSAWRIAHIPSLPLALAALAEMTIPLPFL